MSKYRVPRDIWTSTKPNYYRINNHEDLLDVFKKGLLTHEELRGFLKGNLYKYSFRYTKKQQSQSDLNKMVIYAKALRDLDTKEAKHAKAN